MEQLSDLYGPGARELQDRFDSRRLADRLVDVTVHGELTDADRELVTAQSTVWIATVDPDGWPDVSYKGGAPGFVEVVSPTELRIPAYDGNGMFRTLGNVADTGKVALLFIDTAQLRRIRLHGRGTVSTDPSDTMRHVGAKAVLIITVERVFPNCGRYIHAADRISEHVPAEGYTPPQPSWKQYPVLNEALPHDDPARLDPG